MTDRQQLLDNAASCGMQAARCSLLAVQWRDLGCPGLSKLFTYAAAENRQRGARYLDAATAVVPQARQTAFASSSANAFVVELAETMKRRTRDAIS